MTQAETNPLRAGLVSERKPGPCVVVIFGASGDLTKRKLVPAILLAVRRRLVARVVRSAGFRAQGAR
ncbi:MAG: hypothetical protein QM767_15845 [Anaeromyxobacter sp.]